MARVDVIEYITIASTGDSTDFGNLTVARDPFALASSTRAVFAGGYNNSIQMQNVMDYITIASTGNATDFGDLTRTASQGCGLSSATRGVFTGGPTTGQTVEYITIASTGNATDFGDLTVDRRYVTGTSSTTRGVHAGGNTDNLGDAYNSTMDYITIASAGNSTDFGDLVTPVNASTGVSNAHGGLG
jgi:hypothetical protein